MGTQQPYIFSTDFYHLIDELVLSFRYGFDLRISNELRATASS